MECHSEVWAENVTALGAAGAQLVLAYSSFPVSSHPLLPTVVVTGPSSASGKSFADADVILAAQDEVNQVDSYPAAWYDSMVATVVEVAARRQVPRGNSNGNVHFQLYRGKFGVSV